MDKWRGPQANGADPLLTNRAWQGWIRKLLATASQHERQPVFYRSPLRDLTSNETSLHLWLVFGIPAGDGGAVLAGVKAGALRVACGQP
jgi:hypothetical protein